MTAYGSREERQAWADYSAAWVRQRRWYWPTLAATVAVGVLVVVVQLRMHSPWGWLLSPFSFLPYVVWRVTAIRLADQARDHWREIMNREDVR